MSKRTKDIVILALFTAIIFLMAFIPFLGYIPLGVIKATTIHIPVIIGAILLGPKKGAILGFMFGLTSLINNTLNPSVTSFVFTPWYTIGEIHGNLLSLVICFVPRILVGVVPAYIYKLCKKYLKADSISLLISGVLGSLTNTLLVMNMIYFFFGTSYSAARAIEYKTLYGVILGIIATNGVPEAIVAAVLATVVVKAVKASNAHKNYSLN